MSSRVAQSFVSLQFTFVWEILHAWEQLLSTFRTLLCNTLLTIFYHTFETLLQACANPGNRLIRMICSNVAGIAGVKQQQEHCEAVAEDLVLPIPAPVASASSAPSSSFVTPVADCHGEYYCAILRPEISEGLMKTLNDSDMTALPVDKFW